MRQWVDDQIEVNPTTLAYVDGDEPMPEISDLDLFDDFFGGLELVTDVPTSDVIKLLGRQTWDRESLLQALNKFFGPLRRKPPAF